MESDSEGDDRISSHRATMVALMELQSMQTFRSRFLNLEGRQRRQRGIPRVSLLDPDKSPWQRLYSSGNDQALITVTGFDHQAFGYMLSLLFQSYFYRYTPWTGENDGRAFKNTKLSTKYIHRNGRKRIVTDHACLGLTLAWYRFRGSEFVLQGWFGFTATHCKV